MARRQEKLKAFMGVVEGLDKVTANADVTR